ncbi:MAG TPA: DUF3857 domain-containing protein [Terriglobales bacterium]|nr:DUF3857 domain-containing protein [Terriglobales bacterium]
MLFRRLATTVCGAVFLALTTAASLPVVVFAEDFQPIPPEELKMTSEPLAPGAQAVMLYRQVDRNDNNPPYENNYVRIKILTEEGRKYANIEIPFIKGTEDVKNIRARMVKPDGSIVDFNGEIRETSLVKARGVKVLAKTFTLPDAQVGSIVEYSYTADLDGHLFNSRWILSSALFTKRARFSLVKNVRYSVWWSWHALLPGMAEPKEGPTNVISMEAINIPAFQREDFMPPENELKSRVDFIYSSSPMHPAPDLFWKNLDKNWNEYQESFAGKHSDKDMAKALEQIVSATDPPEVKLRKIYTRVQQIRNTSFELRKTEQEEKRDKDKSPENVEDVWKRGYGNLTALNWLFLALVRIAGLEAYGCRVSDRRQYFFNRETMQSAKLDANVVLVKLNGKDIYLDPGEAFTPFGMLYWTLTGVEGLCLDKDGGTWVRTTVPESSESKTVRSASLKLSEGGDLEGTLKVTYTGITAMHYRTEALHADDLARTKLLEDEVKEQIPGPAEVELTNKPDWSSSDTPLSAEFNLKISGWTSNAGKRVIVPAGIFTAGEKHMFEHVNRIHPMYFEYPYQKADDVTIELPSGWQVGSLPPAQTQDAPAVGYSMKVENGKSTLHLNRNLKLDFMILDQKYYPAIRQFFEFVRTGDEEQIVLQPVAATARD